MHNDCCNCYDLSNAALIPQFLSDIFEEVDTRMVVGGARTIKLKVEPLRFSDAELRLQCLHQSGKINFNESLGLGSEGGCVRG